MPRYFIDFRDGDQVNTDDVGSVTDGFEAARNEAVGLLADVARERPPYGESREFEVMVRDEAGQQLYRATLTFRGERLA